MTWKDQWLWTGTNQRNWLSREMPSQWHWHASTEHYPACSQQDIWICWTWPSDHLKGLRLIPFEGIGKKTFTKVLYIASFMLTLCGRVTCCARALIVDGFSSIGCMALGLNMDNSWWNRFVHCNDEARHTETLCITPRCASLPPLAVLVSRCYFERDIKPRRHGIHGIWWAARAWTNW